MAPMPLALRQGTGKGTAAKVRPTAAPARARHGLCSVAPPLIIEHDEVELVIADLAAEATHTHDTVEVAGDGTSMGIVDTEATTAEAPFGPLSVERRERGDEDWLYVRDASGRDLGHLDLDTDQVVASNDNDLAVIREAAETWFLA